MEELPYKWTQQTYEAVVTVFVPLETRGRDVIFKLTTTKLTVGLKGMEPIIDVVAS